MFFLLFQYLDSVLWGVSFLITICSLLPNEKISALHLKRPGKKGVDLEKIFIFTMFVMGLGGGVVSDFMGALAYFSVGRMGSFFEGLISVPVVEIVFYGSVGV